ncbi:hypothetical protein FB45DRAFT_1005161 [Roridomyces roridus]|uniref:Uncharacterized protein n=1 Tax=Roridomyces roridus TaxID=1738132 RepID=A0AAD7FLJ9_9AGAR|nr:hypothetical protein FB45DRAFT_1005161 [Roridomyces roridus]
MGGTLVACGPDYDRDRESEDFDFDDLQLQRPQKFKTVLIRATIAYLTALSSKQISKELLVKEGVAAAEAVEGVDEAVVIANYRSRIDKGITQVKGWLRPPGPPPEPHPLAHLLSPFQQTVLKVLAKIAYDPDAFFEANPHVIAELGRSGILIFGKMYDANGSVPYPQTQEVAKAFKMVQPYSDWSSVGWPLEDGNLFFGEFIQVFEAAPPGGRFALSEVLCTKWGTAGLAPPHLKVNHRAQPKKTQAKKAFVLSPIRTSQSPKSVPGGSRCSRVPLENLRETTLERVESSSLDTLLPSVARITWAILGFEAVSTSFVVINDLLRQFFGNVTLLRLAYLSLSAGEYPRVVLPWRGTADAFLRCAARSGFAENLPTLDVREAGLKAEQLPVLLAALPALAELGVADPGVDESETSVFGDELLARLGTEESSLVPHLRKLTYVSNLSFNELLFFDFVRSRARSQPTGAKFQLCLNWFTGQLAVEETFLKSIMGPDLSLFCKLRDLEKESGAKLDATCTMFRHRIQAAVSGDNIPGGLLSTERPCYDGTVGRVSAGSGARPF